MKTDRIKVGREPNTDQPIYLMNSGQLVCGSYIYQGRMREDFKGVFGAIWDIVDRTSIVDELDVSKCRYWNALNIYDELIAQSWEEKIDAKTLHDLSIETQIHLMLRPVKDEFMRAIGRAWRLAIRKADPDDPRRPTQAWHLCRPDSRSV